MANKTIIVEIKALVTDISSKLRAVTGNIDKFARSNNNLRETLGLLNNQHKETTKGLKNLDDGQKAVGRGFLGLDQNGKSVAQRYAKLEDSTKKLGAAHKALSADIISGAKKGTAAQQQTKKAWDALIPSIKGTLTSFHKQDAATQQTIRGFAGLDSGIRNLFRQFSGFTPQMQKAQGSVIGLAGAVSRSSQAVGRAGQAFGGFTSKLNGVFSTVGKGVLNFNNIARTTTGLARSIGTSMIFAGGAFRQAGVAINVGSSLFQTLVPVIGSVGSALLSLGPIGAIVAGAVGLFVINLVPLVAGLAAASFGLFETAKAGFEFNALLESTQISIATLITQFNNIYDASGTQIGAFKDLTEAQIKAMSATERDSYVKAQSASVNDKLTASMSLAATAFRALTIEAAQSPFTTQDLAKGFQAVEASLGQYGVSLDQITKLTVTLARVSSVAGISASNLASQFTLFLTGAGRITSPLARFAGQVGLTKQKMQELRAEFQAAKGDPEKLASVMAVITTKLAAFDVAGRRVAQSWAGIMSNMSEAFQLFAGTVTTGLFTSIRDSFIQIIPVIDKSGKEQVEVFNKTGQLIRTVAEEDTKKLVNVYDKQGKLIEGKVKDTTGKIIDGTSAAKTEATGLLSEIFNYDGSGNLKSSVSSYVEVFNTALQPLINFISVLFDTIGSDIRSVFVGLGSSIGGFAGALESNKGAILDIYITLKDIGLRVVGIVQTFLMMFGVSGDVSTNVNRLNSVLFIVDATLFGIQTTFGVIAALVLTLVGIVGAVTAPLGAGFTILADIYKLGESIRNGTFSTHKILGTTISYLGTILGIFNQAGDIMDTTLDTAKNIRNIEAERNLILDKQNRKLQSQGALYTDLLAQLRADKNSGVRKEVDKALTEAKAKNPSLTDDDMQVLAEKAVKDISQRPEFIDDVTEARVQRELVALAIAKENQSIRFATAPRPKFGDRFGTPANTLGQSSLTPDLLGLPTTRKGSVTAEEESQVRRRVIFERASKSLGITTAIKPGNGGDEDDKAKKTKEIQKRVLETLFAEDKAYAEAKLDLEQSLYENDLRLAKERANAHQDTLDTQLAEGEVAFTKYYSELERLSNIETSNNENRIQSEIAALNFRHKVNLEEIKQDEFKNKAELSIANNASKRADAERDLRALAIKRQTEEVKFQTQLKKLEGERNLASLAAESERYARLIKLRDATRAFFEEVRQLRAKLIEATNNPFDADALAFSLEEITRTYAEQFKRMSAIANDPQISAAQRTAATGALNNIAKLESLERERVVAANDLAKLNLQSYKLELSRSTLEEKRNYGLVTEQEYLERNNALRLASIDEYKKKIEKLEELRSQAELNKQLELAKSLREESVETQIKLNKLENVTEQTLLRINDELRSGVSDFFGTVLDDVNNLGDAFTNLGKHIQKTLQKSLIDRLLGGKLFTKLFGNIGQTEGRAQGLAADNGRAMGLDANSKYSKPNTDVFEGTSSNVLDEDGEDSRVNEAKERLATSIASTASETTDLNTQIDTITKLFQKFGLAVDDITKKIAAIKLPVATANPVETTTSGGGDGQRGTKLNGKALGDYVRGLGLRVTNEDRAAGTKVANTNKISKHANSRPGVIDNEALDVGLGDIKDVLKFGNEEVYRRVLTGIKAGLRFVEERDKKGSPHAHFESDTDNPSAFNSVHSKKNYFTPKQLEELKQADAIRRGLIPSTPDTTTVTGGVPTTTITASEFTTQQPLPVAVASVTPQAANGLLKASTETQTLEEPHLDHGEGSAVPSQSFVETSGGLDAIVTSLGEGGALGLIRNAVTSIDTKMGGGLALELNTFLLGLSTALTSVITAPLSLAIQSASVLSGLGSASNVQTKAYGGYISGPGGPTADKVPAWLSNGEYVIKSSAVKALGMDKLHALNNADKELPQFGFGGIVGTIFKSLGKFISSDTGKLLLATAAPLLAQKFLGEKAANALSLAMPFIFSGVIKGKDANKILKTPKAVEGQYFGKNFSPEGRASGGLVGKFAGGGLAHSAFGSLLPKLEGGGGGGGGAGAAVKGGAITAAVSIGMALLGRLFANKQKKKELEEYKKNRVKDPFGFNPDTLTSYKKPIISGSRNYLAKGGLAPQTSGMLLRAMPQFAMGGMNNMDFEDILKDAGMGDSPINLNQNINITTPDVHSFRNSRGQVERDLARVTQRGLKRRAPKY